MRYTERHIGFILKVLVYIDEHLHEPMPLEQMAKIAHISPFYFHRLFQAYVGKTLAEYVKELRLQRAEEQLRYSDKAITEIAFDVGYETPSAFSKMFQQMMQKSPRRYRQLMQPVMEAMSRNTVLTAHQKEMLQPSYVVRKERPVLFVRRIGDYAATPFLAFEALERFLAEEGVTQEQIVSFYSIALDDTNIVEREKCRFDVCVELKHRILPKGEFGEKMLRGGRFALFLHRGPYSAIEESFRAIFLSWYPSSSVVLANAPPFCEMTQDPHQTKLYIPLES